MKEKRADKKLARQIQERDGISYTEALRRAREILAKLEEIRKEEEEEDA